MALVFSGIDGLVDDPEGGKAVFSAVIEETRVGDIIVPSFHVEVKNPGSGSLISGGSRTGAIYEDGQMLARGRMMAVPADIGGDTVVLEFVCVPDDEGEVLRAAADEWRLGEVDSAAMLSPEAVRYDPLFYSRESADPTDVLAATTLFWRWDRRTNSLGTVDLAATGVDHIIGADDILSPDAGGIEGSLRVSPLDPPKKTMKLRLVAAWTQEARGTQTLALQRETDTYSFDDLISSFPTTGTPIGQGTGWHVEEARITSVEDSLLLDTFPVGPSYYNNDPDVAAAEVMLQARTVSWQMRLGYEYSQQREEILDIEMTADMQPVLGDDRKETVDTIHLGPLNLDLTTPEWSYENPETLDRNSYAVGDRVQANGRVWECVSPHAATETFRAYDSSSGQLWRSIAKKSALPSSRARFFDTDSRRGERAIRHAIGRQRRRMLERAHCVEVSFATSCSKGKEINCGDVVRVVHPLIPGGAASGFCSSIRLVFEEDSEMRAEVTLLVPPGNGRSMNAPDYELTGAAPRVPVNVNALPVMAPRVLEVENNATQQRTAALFTADPVATIEELPTRIRLAVNPLTQSDLLTRRLKAVCEPLGVRRGIDI